MRSKPATGSLRLARQPDDSWNLSTLDFALGSVRLNGGLTLDPANGKCLRRYSREHYICDVWLFEQDFDLNDIVLQEGETCGAMYASPEKLRELVDADCFVPFEELEGILEM